MLLKVVFSPEDGRILGAQVITFYFFINFKPLKK